MIFFPIFFRKKTKISRINSISRYPWAGGKNIVLYSRKYGTYDEGSGGQTTQPVNKTFLWRLLTMVCP